MNKKIIYLTIFISLFCLTGFVSAQTGGQGVQIPNYGPSDFCALLKGIATAVAALVGTIGTIMIIVAGIFYLTSAGSPERIGVAKKTLIYAIVGMVIGLAASGIIEIVTSVVSTTGGSCK